jgi:hypothetical protein
MIGDNRFKLAIVSEVNVVVDPHSHAPQDFLYKRCSISGQKARESMTGLGTKEPSIHFRIRCFGSNATFTLKKNKRILSIPIVKISYFGLS